MAGRQDTRLIDIASRILADGDNTIEIAAREYGRSLQERVFRVPDYDDYRRSLLAVTVRGCPGVGRPDISGEIGGERLPGALVSYVAHHLVAYAAARLRDKAQALVTIVESMMPGEITGQDAAAEIETRLLTRPVIDIRHPSASERDLGRFSIHPDQDLTEENKWVRTDEGFVLEAPPYRIRVIGPEDPGDPEEYAIRVTSPSHALNPYCDERFVWIERNGERFRQICCQLAEETV